ncbi:hypothetical protein [uncultured Bosea sp.]|uniref:hypothetical protein n=1 Tax=uncultured Bosea sp. TaxID=211457 RepID=UPI00263ADDBF|nr:hypothetical protein [uncultured Bosea sp.]
MPAEQDRLDEGVTDKTANRLDFVLDDGRRFGRLDVARGLRRQLEQAGEQVETQLLQQPLTKSAFAHVDDVFEAAIDQHKQQKQAR